MISLDKAYNRESFVKFLEDNFLPEDFHRDYEKISLSGSQNFASEACRLGECKSLELEVFEVHHNSLNDARVGIAKDAFRMLLHHSDYNRALIAFVPGDCKQWRFSLLQMDVDLSENNRIKRSYSNPRRYSFLLGENSAIKTPTQFLIEKGRIRDRQEGTKKLNPWEDLLYRFSIEALTKQFYNDLFEWYLWAISEDSNITFPNNPNTEDDDRDNIETKIIRLITRLMFVWFIKQKTLVPDKLFDEDYLKTILIDFDSQSQTVGNYYNAILQNLFFATLNRAIEDEDGQKRRFAELKGKRDIKSLYRYAEMFSISKNEVIDLFSDVPFMNGGLFECLDKTKYNDGVEQSFNDDGFSRNDSRFADGRYRHRAVVPNILFFKPEKGLLEILKRYNFTIEENTPAEQTVALDPELLGKVFENLLGAYNPETKETARNQSGSFYTPREIVSYMVDESLIAYLGDTPLVRSMFKDDFEPDELHWSDYQLIAGKLKSIKVLDPACGSGAFPMGLLNRIVDLLKKIETDKSTYDLKLNIIENCIYGCDIQSIATQITKLRFFISLICDCDKDDSKPNFGIPTLPNLETKFVTANTLIGIKNKGKAVQGNIFIDTQISELKEQLKSVRHKHFRADTAGEKVRLRKQDESLRAELVDLLSQGFQSGFNVEQLTSWNPYDQNTVSDFFDAEWMFNVVDGFDIVIGNPPYISTKGVKEEDKKAYEQEFGFSDDTYNLFTFKGLALTKTGGSLTYIIPKTFWTTQTKRNMRDLLLSKNIRYIFDTANPFESVMVDTCILQVVNKPYDADNIIRFRDGSKDLQTPIEFEPVKQSMYINTQNAVIFKPTELNLKIWNLYGEKVKELYDKWWDKIKTSRDIEKNKAELEKYRASLKPGDVALLGCLTEGGQGLATANNGKYIAIRKSSKWADNVYASRPQKLAEAIKKYSKVKDYINNLNPQEFLNHSTEKQIADTFDRIKEKFGRDIFGQGYIYRLIEDNEIADVDSLTMDEKENGISTDKPYYVPYDKGDKDGNRWYLETPFAIAWSKENVHFLKTNSGKKGEGMPVVRNPQFYFKEGFCWNLINGTRSENNLKFKLSYKGVNDVGGMSLHNYCNCITDAFIVALCNTPLISRYTETFVNFTVNFQVNDCRIIPIVIPTEEILQNINELVNKIIDIKKNKPNQSIRSYEEMIYKTITCLYGI